MKSVVEYVVKYIIIIYGLEQVQDSDHIRKEEYVPGLSKTKLNSGDNARVEYTI